MKIGVDVDGTISRVGFYNPSMKLPSWLFWIMVPFVLLLVPDKKTAEELRRIQNEKNEIIIISARPSWAIGLTKRWLKFHHIPFGKLFCVGFGKGTKQRKLEVIKKEGVQVFVDDDTDLIHLLGSAGVPGYEKVIKINGGEK